MTGSPSYDRASGPLPLAMRLGAVLVGLPALAVLGFALTELGYGVVEREGMAVGVALFLGAYGGGLVAGAVLLLRRRSAARSPLVLAQLLHLGIAWNMRDAPTTPVAIALAASALSALVLLMWPSTTAVLMAADGGAGEEPDRVS
ncbi:hypothetical protein INN71_04245 [Nocardioides sp. ChNu-153]|uniref:hypothetical protein n=1 Tax=unclassified Nocardioides TaxID=2615069 RepID=UPI002405BD6D|nr:MULTISPECIES: hypothetical protein [unclassified Nocardioides]MDF9715435.1 hypothetical protein [Nocardioides sp. ChNu-99]MDN7120598.1 hypothetical protein [Nocardioides sp. ChNu-153]